MENLGDELILLGNQIKNVQDISKIKSYNKQLKKIVKDIDEYTNTERTSSSRGIVINPVPKINIGDVGTYTINGDSSSFEVIQVNRNGRELIIRFPGRVSNKTETITWRKDKRWVKKGESLKNKGVYNFGVSVNQRENLF